MPKNMSISVNGQSQVPPGFRFHPTEEELLHYYLRKKVAYEKIDMDVIRDVDLNKLEPWDIQEKCRIGTAHQNDWYFFSHKDKKYPTGTRTNRATTVGFWKATGRDKVIYGNGKRIGMRKTLVFYRGRAPNGEKMDWIMHEYRLFDENTIADTNIICDMEDTIHEEGWVVCRIFKKKNFHKTLDSSPIIPSSINEQTRTQMQNSSDESSLEQILQYMGKTCKNEENGAKDNNRRYLRPIDTTTTAATATAAIYNGQYYDRLMKLPSLESPNSTSSQACYQPIIHANAHMFGYNEEDHITNQVSENPNSVYETSLINDWAALDRLVASHLNIQTEASKQLACFSDNTTSIDHHHHHHQELRSSSSQSTSSSNGGPYNATLDYQSEIDLWSFVTSKSTLSSPDITYHMSNASK